LWPFCEPCEIWGALSNRCLQVTKATTSAPRFTFRTGDQRAEQPDYEPDLSFKKAKAEAAAEQQSLI
jgi:hypothetical protein